MVIDGNRDTLREIELDYWSTGNWNIERTQHSHSVFLVIHSYILLSTVLFEIYLTFQYIYWSFCQKFWADFYFLAQ